MDVILKCITQGFFPCNSMESFSSKHLENKARIGHNSQWTFSSFITQKHSLNNLSNEHRTGWHWNDQILLLNSEQNRKIHQKKNGKNHQKRTSLSSELMRLQSNRFKRSMFAGHLWLRWSGDCHRVHHDIIFSFIFVIPFRIHRLSFSTVLFLISS